MLNPGAAIGRYVIQRKLAEGGMAEVYLASAVGPEGFAKDVVIKVVRSFLSNDQQFIDMFIAEARLSSRLNHANIVQIFDFGKVEDSYYLAMEYVRGGSLADVRKRCRERGVPLPPTLAAEIGMQVARGLHHAHSLTERGQPLGIVHRDVTPHNVLLSFDGAIKLTDFGIAKASTSQTAPGILKGKFAYMSPEQSRGDPVDARTDVFALGIVLWELLTGGRLFDADSEVGVLKAVQSSTIVAPTRLNPDVPTELSNIVLKALARPLQERFATAFDFERELATFVLRNATSVDDTSSARFLQMMFKEEYLAHNHQASPFDDHGNAATLNVQRDHSGEVQRAGANEQTRLPAPRPELDVTFEKEEPRLDVKPAATPRQSGRISQRLPKDKPKTDLMPAHKPPSPSRKMPEAALGPQDTASDVDLVRDQSQSRAVVTDKNELLARRPSGLTIDEDVAMAMPKTRFSPVVLGLVALTVGAGATWYFVDAHEQRVPLASQSAAPVAALPVSDAEPFDAGAPPAALAPPSPTQTMVESPTPVDAVADAGPVRAKVAAVSGSPAATGVLRIKAVPYATITIDGRRKLEATPSPKDHAIRSGSHDLEVTLPACKQKRDIKVDPNQVLQLDFSCASPETR